MKELREMSISIGAISENQADYGVVGRDALVSRLWKSMKSSSVRILSERRMGKTWFLKLALSRRPDWALPLFVDVEGWHSVPEFIFHLNEKLHENKCVPNDWFSGVTDWFRRETLLVKGLSLGQGTPIGADLPNTYTWKRMLEDTCKRFVDCAEKDKQLAVLIIDELPFFLDNLIKARLEKEAIELLDTLRAIRHQMPSFRLATCGSLGLHIVLQTLKDKGYTGQPMNDMPPFEVPPLSREDATYLAGCLLLGEKIPCKDLATVAQTVAEASSRVPFYVQHIADWMRQQEGKSWTPAHVRKALREIFATAGDPAELKYYDARLDQYYPADIADKARSILDTLSTEKRGLTFDKVLNLVRHRPKTLTVDSDQLRHVIHTLHQDHYIVRRKDRLLFKLEIVRQWWRQERGGTGA